MRAPKKRTPGWSPANAETKTNSPIIGDARSADKLPDTVAWLNRKKFRVERGDRGHFFVVKNGSAIELCVDFASLQAFARRLGVSK